MVLNMSDSRELVTFLLCFFEVTLTVVCLAFALLLSDAFPELLDYPI